MHTTAPHPDTVSRLAENIRVLRDIARQLGDESGVIEMLHAARRLGEAADDLDLARMILSQTESAA